MASKKRTKTRYLDIGIREGNFVTRLIGKSKSEYNVSDIVLLRRLLSNEKARILYTLKNKEPESIYQLAKILKRDFKSVREDVLLLKRFGLIEFYSMKKGKRKSIKPVLTIDQLNIQLDI